MKNLLPKWFVILLLFCEASLYAQDITFTSNDKYGLDPLLYNGKYYTYFVPSNTKGTPFFNSSEYRPGSIELHGLIYSKVELNYDLINQQLVLRYMAEDKGIRHIIVSDAWLEAFTFGKTRFEIHADVDSIRHIYQVIGSGPMHILYAWNKELKLDTKPGARSYFFTPPVKKSFLLIDHVLYKYSSNKSFISVFPERMQSRMKKYLSQKKINIKKASDEVMSDVVSYLNTPPHK